MQEFLNWLTSLDWKALFATVVGFLSVWGGSFIALIVGLLKQRAKNFNYQKALNKLNIQLSQEQTAKMVELEKLVVDKIEELQQSIINNNDTHAQARMQALQTLAEDAKKVAEEVKPVDINSIIEGLD